MYVCMMELTRRMKNKQNKYIIMKSHDVIKLIWNKYIKKSQMEELTVSYGKGM